MSNEQSATQAWSTLDDSPDKKYPLGFFPPARMGLNARTWRFCHLPVFQLRFEKQKQRGPGLGYVPLPYGNDNIVYDIPDGITVTRDVTKRGSEAVTFRGRDSVDGQKFSVAVQASLSVMGVSADTSTQLAQSSNVDVNDTRSSTVIAYYQKIYDFSRDAPDGLAADALDHDFVSSLPSKFEPGDPQNAKKFTDFFTDFGTHVLMEGSFGGLYSMRTVVEETVTDRLTTADIESSVKTSFDDGTASFSAKVDISKSTRDELKTDDKTSSIDFFDTGGPGSGKELDEFLKGVNMGPALMMDATALVTPQIRPLFAPIYTLASDAAVRDALAAALNAYLPAGQTGLSVFGRAMVKAAENAVVQASENGFVVMTATGTADCNPLTLSARGGQDSGAPVLAYVSNSAWRNDSGDRWLERASVILPVTAGDWYETAMGTAAGVISGFIPTRLALGDWSKFENLIVETAGFAAFPVQTPPGEAAVDSLVLQLHASTPEETVLQFMCSAHASEVGTASICVPIPGGSEISTGTPTARRLPAYWLPVSDPAFAFGSPQPMAPNTRYTAETDGFAFGQLGAGSDGSRGWLEIRTLDSAGQEEPLYAGCAGHLFMGDDHQMAMAGTLLPIPRGKDWLVKTFASWGSVDAEVFWIPVNPI